MLLRHPMKILLSHSERDYFSSIALLQGNIGDQGFHLVKAYFLLLQRDRGLRVGWQRHSSWVQIPTLEVEI